MTTQSMHDPKAAGPETKTNPFFSGAEVPWCNGCSYTQLNEKIANALTERYSPREVVLVSDIGCIGIVDKLYACDTVHCLHGRSVTLATGLKMAHGNPNLKVVVFIGDGGCSIGLQHLVEAARLNADLTVFAFDNQNYGMTGGQHSTFTLPDVKTVTTPEGSAIPANDIVRMLSVFPGVFRARLTANDKRIPDAIGQALAHPGFAYVETLNFCASYVGKANRDLALSRVQAHCETFGREFGVFPPGEARPPFSFGTGQLKAPPPAPQPEAPAFQHGLKQPVGILLGGSAGGGVQSAAGMFVRAAVLSGLHISLKSDYPVTVGRGHSTVEIILSPRPILFAGITHPHLAIVCTADGRRALGGFLPLSREVVFQEGLALETGEAVDFEGHGNRNAAFNALALMLQRYGWFPLEALERAVEEGASEKRNKALMDIVAETKAL